MTPECCGGGWGGGVAHEGEGFSGIDPEKLHRVVTAAERDQRWLAERASYYKNQLASYGIGGAEFGGIQHTASWAEHELPLLKRRYYLSLNEGNGPDPRHPGMVRIKEELVSREANAKAAKAARRATELAERDPEDLSPEEFDELKKLFAQNYDEYPFAEKVVGELGAKGTLEFWEKLSNADRRPGRDGGPRFFERADDLDAMQKNLSLTVAAATNSDSGAMRKWKKDLLGLVDKPVGQTGPDPAGGFGGPRGFVVMSSLMRYGDFDDAFLVRYGKKLVDADERVMAGAGSPGFEGWNTSSRVNHLGEDRGNDPFTGYLKALSHSPDAATEFFLVEHKKEDGTKGTNFTYLFEEREWPEDGRGGKGEVTGHNALGLALEAATTGHRPGERATFDDLKHNAAQAELFSAMVASVSLHAGGLTDHSFLSDSFANISAEYLPELHRGLSGASHYNATLFPVSGASATLGYAQAVRFLHAIGRNPEGYDRLNVAEHVYSAELMKAHLNAPAGFRPGSAGDAVVAVAGASGTFQGVLANGAYSQSVKDGAALNARDGAWKKHASTWGGSLVGSATGVATSGFTGPGGVVAGGLAGTATSSIFEGILGGLGEDKEGDEAAEFKRVDDKARLRDRDSLTTEQAVREATTTYENGRAHVDEELAMKAGEREREKFTNSWNNVRDADADQLDVV
nr:hypothetical protein [Streptomyces sp. SID4945]